MKRLLAALLAAAPAPRRRRRGHVDLQQLPLGQGRRQATASRPTPRGSSTCASPRRASPAAARGASSRAQRPGDDEPPLRPRLHRGALHRREGPREDRLPRADAGRGADVPGRGGEPAHRDHRRHRPRATARPQGLDGRGVRRTPCAAEMARIEKECPTSRRAALRRGDALPGRALPPLHVPPLPGRAARLRPGVRHRLLRRRPGQLQVPALRPRRRLLARLRGRQAGAARSNFFALVGDGRRARAS